MTDQPRGLDRGLTNYGDRDFARFLRRSFARSMGISTGLLEQPIVGIAMTPSGFNNCHRHMPELVEAVSRGVLAAGALPRPFPTVSLGEVFLNPTSMMYRNLMAMDTEEMIGAQPMDAVVLIGGCDKTVPAQLMGAASAGLPAIQLVTGPMSTGRHQGQRLGACTDCRGFWAKYRAGTVDSDEIETVEGRLSVTAGTCAVMGTASTMACIAEALGMSLPGTAAIPAVHADRLVAAEETGKAAVRLIASGITPRDVITEKSVENAIRVLMAVGGSTNAIVHLTAVAGRLGIRIPYARFNELSDETPVLVDLKPVGEGYMEDFHAAGGMGALLRELRPLLHLDTIDVEGRTLAERLDEPPAWVDRAVIRPFADPVSPVGGLVALTGSLAPDGAIFKRAAATPALFESEGRAVVFTGLDDLAGASTTRISMSRRTTCSCCRTPARTRRECRRRDTCRSQASWHRPASRTWSGYRTRACPGPPSARSCCTSRRKRPWAARWPPCGTATGSGSRSRTSASTCWSRRRRSGGVWRASSRRPHPPAATRRSTAAPSCRPRKVATSTS